MSDNRTLEIKKRNKTKKRIEERARETEGFNP